MAGIQGGLPAGLETIHRKFGGKAQLVVYVFRDRQDSRVLEGWKNLDVLKSEVTVTRFANDSKGSSNRSEPQAESMKPATAKPEASPQGMKLADWHGKVLLHTKRMATNEEYRRSIAKRTH